MTAPRRIGPSDLFVVLEKAYRRGVRRCGKCGFTVPFPVFRGADGNRGDWAVDPSPECTSECTRALEDLVFRMRKEYRLQ